MPVTFWNAICALTLWRPLPHYSRYQPLVHVQKCWVITYYSHRLCIVNSVAIFKGEPCYSHMKQVWLWRLAIKTKELELENPLGSIYTVYSSFQLQWGSWPWRWVLIGTCMQKSHGILIINFFPLMSHWCKALFTPCVFLVTIIKKYQ